MRLGVSAEEIHEAERWFSIRRRSSGSWETSAAGGNGGGTGGTAGGPDPEIGMGWVLARGVHLDVAGERLDRVAGGLDGQLGLVAFLAQMQEDNVPESLAPRSFQDGLYEVGALAIREVSFIAEVRAIKTPGRPDAFCIATSWLNSTPSTSTSARLSAIASDQLPVSAR